MRRLLTTLALLVLAGHLAATDRAARAEGGAPPPPGFGDDQLTIPKELIRAYLSQVHPSYLRWLGNGDGSGEDSLAAFTIYLSTQPVNRFEHWCFTQLYIRSH